MLQCEKHLCCVDANQILIQPLEVRDQLLQVSSGTKFQHQDQIRRGLEGVVERNYARMGNVPGKKKDDTISRNTQDNIYLRETYYTEYLLVLCLIVIMSPKACEDVRRTTWPQSFWADLNNI